MFKVQRLLTVRKRDASFDAPRAQLRRVDGFPLVVIDQTLFNVFGKAGVEMRGCLDAFENVHVEELLLFLFRHDWRIQPKLHADVDLNARLR